MENIQNQTTNMDYKRYVLNTIIRRIEIKQYLTVRIMSMWMVVIYGDVFMKFLPLQVQTKQLRSKIL